MIIKSEGQKNENEIYLPLDENLRKNYFNIFTRTFKIPTCQPFIQIDSLENNEWMFNFFLIVK